MSMQVRRTATANNAPVNLDEGQLAVEMASVPPRLWCGVPLSIDPSGRVLVAAGGDFVPLAGGTMLPMDGTAGRVALSRTASNGNAMVIAVDGTANWSQGIEINPTGGMATGILIYNNGSSGVNVRSYSGVSFTSDIENAAFGLNIRNYGTGRAINLVTSDILNAGPAVYIARQVGGVTQPETFYIAPDLSCILAHDPMVPLEAATKNYVDTTAVPLAGGTMLPNDGTPGVVPLTRTNSNPAMGSSNISLTCSAVASTMWCNAMTITNNGPIGLIVGHNGLPGQFHGGIVVTTEDTAGSPAIRVSNNGAAGPDAFAIYTVQPTWRPMFAIRNNGTISFTPQTNALPQEGDLWYDGTHLNFQTATGTVAIA
jgi:hypothetical protein